MPAGYKLPHKSDTKLDFRTYKNIVQDIQQLLQRSFSRDFEVQDGTVRLANPPTAQYRFAKIINEIDDSSSGYSGPRYEATEQEWDNSTGDWIDKTGGRTWGDDSSDYYTSIFEIQGRTIEQDKVYQVFKKKDNAGFYQWYCQKQQPVQAPFTITIDNDNWTYSVVRGRVFSTSTDRLFISGVNNIAFSETIYIYLPIVINASTGVVTTNAITDYNGTNDPSFWTRDAGNNLVINYPIGKIGVSGVDIELKWNNTGDIILHDQAGQTVAINAANSTQYLEDILDNKRTYNSGSDIPIKYDKSGSAPDQSLNFFFEDPAGDGIKIDLGSLAADVNTTPVDLSPQLQIDYDSSSASYEVQVRMREVYLTLYNGQLKLTSGDYGSWTGLGACP